MYCFEYWTGRQNIHFRHLYLMYLMIQEHTAQDMRRIFIKQPSNNRITTLLACNVIQCYIKSVLHIAMNHPFSYCVWLLHRAWYRVMLLPIKLIQELVAYRCIQELVPYRSNYVLLSHSVDLDVHVCWKLNQLIWRKHVSRTGRTIKVT